MATLAEALFSGNDAEVKTQISSFAKDDAIRLARRLGCRSLADFVRDAILNATYGADAVQKCHAARLRGAAGLCPDPGPETGFGSALEVLE